MWDLEFRKKLREFYSLKSDSRVRRSGRTTIIAETILDVALENPGRNIRYDIDHFIDTRGLHPTSDDMLRRIEETTTTLRREHGIEIQLSVDRRQKTFQAYRIGHNMGSVFPIAELKIQLEKVKFLDKQLLLLL